MELLDDLDNTEVLQGKVGVMLAKMYKLKKEKNQKKKKKLEKKVRYRVVDFHHTS